MLSSLFVIVSIQAFLCATCCGASHREQDQDLTLAYPEYTVYAQYAALGSFCVAPPQPVPCSRDFGLCVSELVSANILSPALTLATTNVYPFSTYHNSHSVGANGAIFIRKEADKTTVVVSIAGSTTVQDYLNDFNFLGTEYKPIAPSSRFELFKNAKIHRGFFAIYQKLAPVLTRLFSEVTLKHSFSELVLTGHSLGGVLANLFMMDVKFCQLLLAQGENCPIHVREDVVLKLFTYGQPRFGNSALMDMFETLAAESVEISRFINPKDLVPLLPPTAIFGYSHVAGRFYMILESAPLLCNGAINFFEIDGTVLHCDTREEREMCNSLSIFANKHADYFCDLDKVKQACLIMDRQHARSVLTK